jgi:hypothetical protein
MMMLMMKQSTFVQHPQLQSNKLLLTRRVHMKTAATPLQQRY